METALSYLVQGNNYARLFSSRVVATVKKLSTKGSASFSTPRIPHTTPSKPPSWWQNAKNTLKAFFKQQSILLNTPTFMILIGSAFNTSKENTYTHNQITHVLNCAGKGDKLPRFYQDHIDAYLHIPMRDEFDENINFIHDPIMSDLRHFLCEFFSSQDPSNKHTLLLHCVYGRSRSVAIAILILFLYQQMLDEPRTMFQCYAHIGKLRKEIYINSTLMEQLVQFQSEFEENAKFRDSWLSIFS